MVGNVDEQTELSQRYDRHDDVNADGTREIQSNGRHDDVNADGTRHFQSKVDQ